MEKNVHEIEIKLEKEWLDALDKTFKEKNKELKIDGFRKGAAPKEIFIKKFGIESLYQDALNGAINIGYKRLLDENKDLIPVIEPSVDIINIDKTAVTLKYIIITKPEVKLGSYKNLGVKKEAIKVTDKEVEDEIKHLQEQMADQVVKDNGEVAEGDTVLIDFAGYVDEKPLEGGNGSNYPLEIGSGQFIPGFETGLIGKTKGEKVTLKLKFPDNYTKELAGKNVKFDVTINEIKTRVIPDINEDFFKDLGYNDMKSVDELKKEVKNHIKHEKEHSADDKFIDDCLEAASKNMKVTINEEIIHDEVHRIMDQYAQQLKMQGMDLNTYYHITNTTEDDLHKKMEPEAIKRIKYRYLLEAIAEEEKIEFTKKDVDKKAKEMADNYGITVEELIKAYGSLDVVKYDMRMHRALEIIKEQNDKKSK
jgi:trigger factor